PSGSRNERVDTSLKEKEAPTLRRLVGAGELPPLEERLPENPMVVEPHEKPGPYGGTWNLFGDSPPLGGDSEVFNDWLVRWSPDWAEVLPNLAESWEIEDDGRIYTFHLRE